MAELVCARNKHILATFSEGLLSRQLLRSDVPTWYARQSPAHSWTLVDERCLSRWYTTFGLPQIGSSLTDVLQHLAAQFGISIRSMQRVVRGEPLEGLELTQLRADPETPSLMIQGDRRLQVSRRKLSVSRDFR